MSEQEYKARDLALCIELQEERDVIIKAQREILQANMRMKDLYKERMTLRIEYNKSKQGGQHHD